MGIGAGSTDCGTVLTHERLSIVGVGSFTMESTKAASIDEEKI